MSLLPSFQRKGDKLMGNRVTRAATHLSEDAVYARMQREPRPWRRKLWEIISQALTAPRPAEDIARTVGVSVSTVHRVIAAYNREGVAAIETPGKGGGVINTSHWNKNTPFSSRSWPAPFRERS